MGPDSPTSFKPGDLTNQEMQLQADFVYDISDSLSLAFGASYLDETYKVVQGELNSYLAGPMRRPILGTSATLTAQQQPRAWQ